MNEFEKIRKMKKYKNTIKLIHITWRHPQKLGQYEAEKIKEAPIFRLAAVHTSFIC